MAKIISRANPFRFHGVSNDLPSIDYSDNMPKFDLMDINTQYIKGEYPTENYYSNWVAGEELFLQIQADLTTPHAFPFEAYLYREDMTIAGDCDVIDITPVGWTGLSVWKIAITPGTAGNYFIGITFYGTPQTQIYSDLFTVHSDLSTTKDLIKLQYKNSSNKFDMVWDDYYTAFYAAKYDEADDEQENTVTKTDTGTSKQNSINYPGIDVVFTDIKKRYKQTICKQLQCDTLIFNDVNCVCEEAPTSEKTDNTDIIDMSVKLLYAGGNDNLDIF